MDNASKKQFKKSFIGGFKREDVANYIAAIAQEHNAEIERLKEEMNALGNKNAELKNEVTALSSERKELLTKAEELEIVSGELVDAKNKISELASYKEEAEAQISALGEENSKLVSKLNEYIAKEQEINRSKEKIADLELAAHRRATEIEEAARAQAEQKDAELREYRDSKYTEVNRNVDDIAGAYQRTKAAVSEFKIGFKNVVSDLAREIDVLAEASLSVEQSINELNGKSKEITGEGE